MDMALQKYLFHQKGSKQQYFISVAAVATVALLALMLHNIVGYKVVAFMLLVVVSVLAMFLDIIPVVVAATLSAVTWDFLFIPPRFTLTVGTPEDQILLFTYFIIAMINAVLTHKIREMEKQVKAKDEKANSARFYNTLLNSLSHELRTPITAILGCTDTLQSNAEKLTEKNKTDLVAEISVASMRLNQHVEDLINLSRLESGFFEVKKDWCDVNDLIHKTLQRLAFNLRKYRLAVYIPEHFPLFKLDFSLMEQVIYNLVINATQHTPEDTVITIQADHTEGHLIITIADNGTGFSALELANVFSSIHRRHAGNTGRMGLGLSIVRGFVEAHNGTVKIENLPVCGSKFTIDIPTEMSHLNKSKYE